MDSHFCNPNITIQDWYCLAKSKQLATKSSLTKKIGSDDILLRRFKNGKVFAFQRYCPHMGTDLRLAQEKDSSIECAFHGLRFKTDGACIQTCSHTEKYNLKTYPVTEKYGLIFVFLGSNKPHDLPELSLDKGPIFHSPTQKINCHPHMILCNGLDKVHTKFVHTWDTFSYSVRTEEYKVIATLKGVYRAWWMMLLNNTYAKPLAFTFTSYGSTISVADVTWHNTRLVILFTAYTDGSVSWTNTALYMDTWNPFKLVRGALVTFAILWQDAKILNSMKIVRNFTKEDEGVLLYESVLNKMPLYSE